MPGIDLVDGDLLNLIEQEIIDQYEFLLQAPPIRTKGKLRCLFYDGAILEIRHPTPEEYSFHYFFGELIERIDTSPYHPNLPTFPNHHHHLTETNILEDLITIFPGDPVLNTRNFIDYILTNYYPQDSEDNGI
ncbi:MAG TPA: DUF6516 family protein [Candidatus Lokiarchaeia archaeon]|nr:DUF6516 family protein [Candidatus Lokiarchaeia archaeon]